MKEIRIYQSLWKNILLAIACFAFAVGGWWMINDIHATRPKQFYCGVGCLIFGGLGGLFVLTQTLHNRICHIPFLIIYDDRLDIYVLFKRTYRTIYFRDVKRFRQISIHSNKLIAIDYERKTLMRKMDEASSFTRSLIKFNIGASGAIESINGANLTMKSKIICDILNERLKKWRDMD